MSANAACPDTSRPKANKSGEEDLNSFSSSKLLKPTNAADRLGISIPTKDLPGIGASMRIGCAANAKDKSFCNATILDNFTPSAGFKVYWVTVGPTLISAISTGIPKVSNVRLIILELALRSPEEGLPSLLERRSKGGKSLATRLGSLNISGSSFGFSEETC